MEYSDVENPEILRLLNHKSLHSTEDRFYDPLCDCLEVEKAESTDSQTENNTGELEKLKLSDTIADNQIQTDTNNLAKEYEQYKSDQEDHESGTDLLIHSVEQTSKDDTEESDLEDWLDSVI